MESLSGPHRWYLTGSIPRFPPNGSQGNPNSSPIPLPNGNGAGSQAAAGDSVLLVTHDLSQWPPKLGVVSEAIWGLLARTGPAGRFGGPIGPIPGSAPVWT
jgi:hypothetical protein